MAKEEADKVEMERLKLQKNDTDFAMKLSAQYHKENLEFKLKRKEAQFHEQNRCNSLNSRNVGVAQCIGDEHLARRIAADECRLSKQDEG